MLEKLILFRKIASYWCEVDTSRYFIIVVCKIFRIRISHNIGAYN